MNSVHTYFEELHQMPEIGWQEHKTSAYIIEKLRKMGFDTIHTKVGGKTGVIAVLDSHREGPVIGLRADMDALSFNGPEGSFCYHGCGHDAHSAMVLAVAENMIRKGIERGKVYFIFQPAEEAEGGSASIAEAGLMDDLEEMVGLHLRPNQESRLGQVTTALRHAGINTMEIKISGVSSHGARPHLGVNALHVASLCIQAVTNMYFNPGITHSIKATRLISGGASTNTIPDHADLVFDIRSQTNELLTEIVEGAKKIVFAICDSMGATCQIRDHGMPAADYDEELIEVMEEAVREVGLESLGQVNTPGAEDFHFYKPMMGIRVVYVGIGADLTPGLHHATMSFDQRALEDGVKLINHYLYKRLDRQ